MKILPEDIKCIIYKYNHYFIYQNILKEITLDKELNNNTSCCNIVFKILSAIIKMLLNRYIYNMLPYFWD